MLPLEMFTKMTCPNWARIRQTSFRALPTVSGMKEMHKRSSFIVRVSLVFNGYLNRSCIPCTFWTLDRFVFHIGYSPWADWNGLNTHVAGSNWWGRAIIKIESIRPLKMTYCRNVRQRCSNSNLYGLKDIERTKVSALNYSLRFWMYS